MDYNRVRLQTLRVTPPVFWESRRGSRLEFLADLADIQVDKTEGRITETSAEIKPEVFSHHIYSKMGVMYSYKNYDNASLPTMGLDFKVSGIWTATLSQSGRNFPFVSGHANVFTN